MDQRREAGPEVVAASPAALEALTTDIGGVLSHGSIVAREYGIPAVLGTGSATRLIHTGDEITLDGAAGTVRLPGAVASADPEPALDKRKWLLIGGVAVLVGATVAHFCYHSRARR